MDELKYTSDIWFASFLMLRGYKINNYIVIGKGRVKCGFALSDAEWQTLKLEFNNSELIRYKALHEQIKDLAY